MKKLILLFLLSCLLFGWGLGGGGSSSATTYTKPKVNYQMDKCIWNGIFKEVEDNSGNDYNGTSYNLDTEKNSTVDGMICNVGDFSRETASDSSDNEFDLIELPTKGIDKDINFTTIIWYKTTKDKTSTLFSGANDDKDDEIRLYIVNSGKVHLWIKQHHLSVRYDTNITDGKWHQFAWTRVDKRNCLTFDGDTDNKHCGDIDDSEGELNVSGFVLGQDQDKILGGYDSRQEFNGYLDEFKIYDTNLSDDEIKKIYNNEKDRKNYDGTERSCHICPTINYQMDKCIWSGIEKEIKDSDKNHIDGKSVGGTTTEINYSVGGGICKVADFSNENSSIEIPENRNLQIKYSQVYMGWIKHINNDDGYIFMNNKKENDIKIVNNKLEFSLIFDGDSEATTLTSDTTLNNDEWYHITVVFDYGNQKMIIYINGDKDVDKDIGGGFMSSDKEVDNDNNKSYLGSDGTGEYFAGYIDEFKVFDTLLDKDKIKNIYNNEKAKKSYNNLIRDCSCPTPIAIYRMDSCEWNGTKEEVIDSGLFGYSGYSENMSTSSISAINMGGNFIDDSKKDAVSLNYKAMNGLDDFSVSVWIKTSATTKQQEILQGLGSSTSDDEFEINLGNNNKFRVKIRDKDKSFRLNDDELTDNEWHNVVLTRKGENVCLYIDGNRKQCKTGAETGKLEVHKDSLIVGQEQDKFGGGFSEKQNFIGYIDELVIFDATLSKEFVKQMYENEKNYKNYDGTNRDRLICFVPSYFDAWNDDNKHNLNDRNITTKIVEKEFSILISSIDEKNEKYKFFTGTVCSTVIDKNDVNLTEWKKLYFDNETNKTETYKVDLANKDVRIKLSWLSDENKSCPLDNEDNSTISTDNFAIRPDKFDIDVTNKIYASDEFNISFFAFNFNGKKSLDYNETNKTIEINSKILKDSCNNGKFSLNISFQDGISKRVAKYDEIGEFNLTIQDKVDNNFAEVDRDDTNDTERKITAKTVQIYSKPYKISLHTNFSNDKIIAMSKSIKDSFMELNTTLKALDKDNKLVKNFDNNCYSKDINISYKVLKDKLSFSIKGIYSDDINDTNLSRWENNFTINKSNFKKGEGNFSIKFNVYKSKYSISPKKFNFTNVGITTPNLSKIDENETLAKNISFHYLRVISDDVLIENDNDRDANLTLNILVYDDKKFNNNEKLVNWYLDENYLKKDFKILGTSTNIFYYQDKNVTDFNVSIDEKGKVIVENKNDKNSYVIIHIQIPNYMWYSKYSDYNDLNGSNCISHLCIEYNYKSNNPKLNEVGSGNFIGSELNNSYKIKTNRKGMKIYR